jgi:hypothetical protein
MVLISLEELNETLQLVFNQQIKPTAYLLQCIYKKHKYTKKYTKPAVKKTALISNERSNFVTNNVIINDCTNCVHMKHQHQEINELKKQIYRLQNKLVAREMILRKMIKGYKKGINLQSLDLYE